MNKNKILIVGICILVIGVMCYVVYNQIIGAATDIGNTLRPK